MSGHTPGPWKAGREDMQSFDASAGRAYTNIYADDERGGYHKPTGEALALIVAKAVCENSKVPLDEQKANARLIAAAPEMYQHIAKFLKAPSGVAICACSGPRVTTGTCWYCEARALLAKIDGAS